MSLRLCFLLLMLSPGWIYANPASTEVPVWIDADPACDKNYGNDVDDCWALAYAIFSKKLRISGISTVFGNIAGKTTYSIGLHFLNEVSKYNHADQYNFLQGASVPITQSMASNEAVEALHNNLQKEKLTIISLGPLSNIALLLHHYPEDINLIHRVIAVAGQRDLKQMRFKPKSDSLLHMHDLNFRKDVDAFQKVMDSGVPLTLIPFELASQLVIEQSDLRQVSLHSELATWLTDQSKPWLKFWKQSFDVNGFYPFDLLAIVYVTNPKLFVCETVSLKIIKRRSLFMNSRSSLLATADKKKQNRDTYCYRLNKETKSLVMANLTKIGD